MNTVGSYLEYRGVYSVLCGDIMMHVRGYYEHRVGKIFCYLSTPTVLNIPYGTPDIPHMYYNISPWYSNYKGWYPPTVLEHLSL